MAHSSKKDLVQRVILGARRYGISTVLFRNLVGEGLGINVTDMECLGLLFHQGIASPSELSRYTGLSSGATTAMLDRLERAGLIKRRPNPHDRRGTLIVLQRAGAKRLAPWFASVRDVQERLVSGYSEAELQVIAGFLERATRMWDEEREKILVASRLVGDE